MSLDQLVWTRQTYSILDWLGDLGGLIEILHHIGGFLVAPITGFTIRSAMLASFFRFKFSDNNNGRKSKVVHPKPVVEAELETEEAAA